ncbi:penicillin-binding protein 1A [Ectothiorhodospiraceae bacterium 2226]|nr:penicillin-binding protein 1A [Ectothiorhodospiraceae bacterium 2226]
MKYFYALLRYGLATLFALVTAGAVAAVGTYLYLAPQLPSIEVLTDVRFQVPLRVYSRDGALMAEFGEQRRSPLSYEEMPEQMIQAVLAAEDDRFFSHPGVDYQGIARAALHLARTGEKAQGGSTITMQLARNFFLSREKTYLRKINEILLALKIERELSKEQILELYLNKIFLGNRAYGVGAAALGYYGTTLENLSVAQTAMIAGLPKAPAAYNPLVNPQRALLRRNYVLGRMHLLGYIDDETYQAAMAEEDQARAHGPVAELEAPYVAEMVRADMLARFGNEAYTAGYRVYTTLDGNAQRAANQALRAGLMTYDTRHGYRGPEAQVDVDPDEPDGWDRHLVSAVGGLRSALIVDVEERAAIAYIGRGQTVRLEWPGLSWARRYINANAQGPAPQAASEIVAVGDRVRVRLDEDGAWHLAQVPDAGAALVALDPRNGAITALVGGFDFFHSHYNRAFQAQRQAGSAFKPFVYSAALERGYTPASLVNDAPVVFDDPGLEATWRPENYTGRFYGPTRLRESLVHSRNLVSIRLLRSIGIPYTINHTVPFGFDRDRLPRDLSLSLGSGSVTPLELTAGYAVFANGGYRVEPHFIERIVDAAGDEVFRADPPTVCPECPSDSAARGLLPVSDTAALQTDDGYPLIAPLDLSPPPRPAERVISAQNAYLMTSMMRDVIDRGTARAARQLRRADLAGKTGTTNDLRDAWFAGYNGQVVASAWVGFDTPRSLGARETGGRTALPIWMDFMGRVLDGVEEQPFTQPPGLVTVRIDPASGLLSTPGSGDAIFETFPADQVPQQAAAPAARDEAGGSTPSVMDQLF